MRNSNGKLLFWLVVISVVVADFITKRLAVTYLSSGPVPIIRESLVLKLVYNPGAAFGLHVGDYSRWVFMVLALIALVVLGAMVRQTLPTQRFRLLTLGLVCGGAVGNLLDRVRSSQGVVDFIDVWVGKFHWPTFNVADMAVSCGAIALALVLWSEGKQTTTEESVHTAEASP